MRALWETIPQAEEYLQARSKQKLDDYKRFREMEILRGLQDYENEHQEAWEYEVMKINRRSTWRTLIIGIPGYDGKKLVHSHVVEIIESANPDYFKECMMRYAPGQALSSDKPF